MSSTSKRTASVISLGRRRGLAASAVSYGSGLSTQDERVDVGEGKTATEVEQLIAHLEQHGVIRCTLEDQPLENYTPPPNTGEPVREEDARQLYYYYCIPCECRLTSVSNKSASVAMLEDVHYHVSAATHRVAASCLPGEDLQPTLVQHPLVDPFLPRIDAEEELHPNYLRIHVNGLPFLISRRPGGGDLFFPIPLDPVFPPTEAVWYRPLTSIYSLMKQVIIRRRPAKSAHGHTRVVLKVLRAECEVQHVPMVDYLRQKHIVNRHIIPSTPAIIRFCPKVLPRPGESSATVNGSSKTIPRRHRVAYVAGVSDFIGYRRKRGMNAPQQLAMDRVSVKSEEVFRAGLLARTDSLFRRVFHNAVGDNDPSPQEATVSGQPPLPEEEPHAPLTQELLSTVVGYTVKGEARPLGELKWIDELRELNIVRTLIIVVVMNHLLLHVVLR